MNKQTNDYRTYLKTEIDDIKEMIIEFKNAKIKDIDYEINMSALRGKLHEFETKLDTLCFYESNYDMEIAFEGGKESNHNINGRFFAETIIKAQDLFSEFVVNKMGELKPKGGIPKNLKSIAEFDICASKAASFDVVINFPSIDKLNQIFEPNSIQYIDLFKDLLSGDISKEYEIEIVSFSRLRNKYEDYLKHIQKNDTLVKFRTHNKPIYSKIDTTIADSKLSIFKKYKIENVKSKDIEGKLVGGDTEYGRFHIRVNENENYDGEIDESIQSILDESPLTLNTYVKAKIDEISIQTETSQKTTYKLKMINKIDYPI